jgi:hypothetical protein
MDYECDYGFTREFNSKGICQLEVDPDIWEKSIDFRQEEQCKDLGYYEVSQGYRKIPGNICIDGLQVAPYRYSCGLIDTLRKFFSSFTGFVCLILMAILVYLLSIANLHALCKKIPLISSIPKLW